MEIHIGDRVADVTLVSKDGNKVQVMIDDKLYDVDIAMDSMWISSIPRPNICG